MILKVNLKEVSLPCLLELGDVIICKNVRSKEGKMALEVTLTRKAMEMHGGGIDKLTDQQMIGDFAKRLEKHRSSSYEQMGRHDTVTVAPRFGGQEIRGADTVPASPPIITSTEGISPNLVLTFCILKR